MFIACKENYIEIGSVETSVTPVWKKDSSSAPISVLNYRCVTNMDLTKLC
jgi:hypothetical protein